MIFRGGAYTRETKTERNDKRDQTSQLKQSLWHLFAAPSHVSQSPQSPMRITATRKKRQLCLMGVTMIISRRGMTTYNL